jgi:hypothetical protein
VATPASSTTSRKPQFCALTRGVPSLHLLHRLPLFTTEREAVTLSTMRRTGSVGHLEVRTRLELEHRNIDRHGSGWQAISQGVSDEAGWPLYLSRYASLFTDER